MRSLLRDDAAEASLNTLQITDSDLRSIFLFVKDGMQLDCLDGCRILRLGNGKLGRIEQSQTEIYYIVDIEGYEIFKDIVADHLVRPSFLHPGISAGWALPKLNIQRVSAAAIDCFVQKKLKPQLINTYSSEDTEWIKRVSAYVSSKNYDVNFYRTLPTLRVLNSNTFVSLEAWDSLPILPPIRNSNNYMHFSRIADSLPGIYVLSDMKYPPLAQKVRDCQFTDRFLDSLYLMVNGKCSDLENLFREKVARSDLIVSPI